MSGTPGPVCIEYPAHVIQADLDVAAPLAPSAYRLVNQGAGASEIAEAAKLIRRDHASLDFDVITEIITEITFESKSDYNRMVREMADPAIRLQVVEDEKRFMDRSATVVLLVDEERTPLTSTAAA